MDVIVLFGAVLGAMRLTWIVACNRQREKDAKIAERYVICYSDGRRDDTASGLIATKIRRD